MASQVRLLGFVAVACLLTGCGETGSADAGGASSGTGTTQPGSGGGGGGFGGAIGAGGTHGGGGQSSGGSGTSSSGGGDPSLYDGGAVPDTHVDAGGECAPDAAGVYDQVACCDGVACRGWCYLSDGGTDLFCNCGQPPWGVLGGCPEGTICCAMAGCVAPGFCHDPGH